MSNWLGLILFVGFAVILVLAAIIYTLYYNIKILKNSHNKLVENQKELKENNMIVPIDKTQIFEFGSAMDLIGLPVIVFTQGKQKYKFLLDTGSNVTYVNSSSNLELTSIELTESYIGCEGNTKDCTLGLVKFTYKNKEYEHTVRVADLSAAFNNLKQSSGVELTGIIGNDFMEKYKYCIDFKELIVYSRK